MKLNRRFILLYDLLILVGIILLNLRYGPYLFGSELVYYLVVSFIVLVSFIVTRRSFMHPTPIEVVSDIVNLIVSHHFVHPYERYDEAEINYVTQSFLKSQNFNYFFYEEFDYTRLSTTVETVRLKLAIKRVSRNKSLIVIKVSEERYIKFTVIKEAKSYLACLLHDWKLNQMEYVSAEEFNQLKQLKA